MRRPSVFLDRRESLDVAMTPMIDVVFLLLVFFVWTASFQLVEYSLPSTMAEAAGSLPVDPSQPPPPEADFEQVVIRVLATPNGTALLLNNQPLSGLQALQERLRQISAVRRDTPVIVHPDPDVTLDDAVGAFDAAIDAQLEKVAFAAAK